MHLQTVPTNGESKTVPINGSQVVPTNGGSNIMLTTTIEHIRKRDGVTLQDFDVDKIYKAIRAAWTSCNVPVDEKVITAVVKIVLNSLSGTTVDVEIIQDAVETALMKKGQFTVAKAYILYRSHRQEVRQLRAKAIDPKGISDYIHASKYARYLPEAQRREVYEETVARVEKMHLKRFPEMASEIKEAFDFVRAKKVLPSMRSMQFAGKAVERNNSRLYNCLGRETEFITDQGVRSFKNFKDGDVIKVLTHTGFWKKAVVRNFGKQKLVSIKLSRGKSSNVIRATTNHEWILVSGDRSRKLKLKDKLYRPPKLISDWVYEKSTPEGRLYWAMGYIYGDGTLCKNEDGEPCYSMARLCGDDGRFLSRFQELGFSWSKPPSYGGEAIVYTGKYLKTLPSVKNDGYKNVMAFVRGYLDADGHKNYNWGKNKVSEFNGIQASDPESIQFIRTVFPMVGAYITREVDLTGQETNYGTREKTSLFGLVLGFGRCGCSTFSVQSIGAPSKTEDVWCLVVEDDHSFVMPNGVVTGNCSFSYVDRWDAFSEALFLLLSGCGVGYSVQFDHVEKLSPVGYIDQKKVVHHVVEDSIEGWADALKALLQSYQNGTNLEFSFHKIRPAGAPLKTSGGRAPGHLELKKSLERIRSILFAAQGRKLRPIECHKIITLSADAVLSGGIRRSACICLFSYDDSEMMYSKTGNWYADNPWFANANNSVILKRDEIKKKQFKRIFQMTKQWGEPGFYFTNNYDYGTNPCCEVSIYPTLTIDSSLKEELAQQKIFVEVGQIYTGWGFCNLCEINAAKFICYEDFEAAARAATLIGTIQATYTKMPYLGWVSEQIVKRDALLGISMTGMLDTPEISCNPEYQRKIAAKVKEWNTEYAARLGIRPAARTTCIKPSGTASLLLNCVGSGHHAHHARRYIRRVIADELEPVFQAFKSVNPHMCLRKPSDGKWVIEFPVEVSSKAIIKEDLSALKFLDMVKSTQQNWVIPGTADETAGLNHNVSNTVMVRPEEWDSVLDYLWANREFFTGVALLPSSGDKDFAFSPNESITTPADEQKWNDILLLYKPVDYTALVESEDGTHVSMEPACAGGLCSI